MGEREFIIYLDPPERLNRYRHYHAWQGNQITEFRIRTKRLSVINGIPSSDTMLHTENRIGIFYILTAMKQKNGSRCKATLRY